MTALGRLRRRTLLRAAAAGTTAVAAGCARDASSVQAAVVWNGDELARFRAVVANFPAPVRVIGVGNDIDSFLTARQSAGTSPDVAVLSRPGLVVEYAERGWLSPVTPTTGYAPPAGLADLLTVDGRRYGVWIKAAHKSLFWHFPSLLDEPPKTWDQLVSQTRRLAARHRADGGPAPLAIGAADGWVLTDWFENALLDVAGAEVYDALARGEADWQGQPVRYALDRLAELWSVDGAFPDGGRRALLTQFEESVIQVVHHRTAVMVFEADFVDAAAARFRRGNEPLSTFRFPGARHADKPLVVGGDVAVAFAGSAGGVELVHWLSNRTAFGPWLEAGGYLSPNLDVPVESHRDPLRRRLAEELRAAETVQFDLSDRLPGTFTGTDGVGIWRIMQDFFMDVTDGTAARYAVSRTTRALAAAARAARSRR
ncbi:sugar ABC transporter substrate-binding protein [Micromonospora sonchi]|uniref:Sugar ABC transporter substrate-binding protein n=1 Tax=Micromonospora sonchi TaxID=1763543 RepID=A0A917U0L8_9ACTN|nr:extracellular solute-binding protein [Micromonospora sonchi]GGM46632.1 sugar ABC transporter substrate-binding protein [Micromonospora sonchi]